MTGGCLLVRRDCFRQLGGLDESFFLYYEDVDFCRRAAAAGWGVWFDPSLEVTHHWPLHLRRVPAPLRLMTRHALLTYARKHWSGWRARMMSAVVWAEAVARQGWAVVRADWDASRCYGHLRRLVGDVASAREKEARRRIRFAAAFLDPDWGGTGWPHPLTAALSVVIPSHVRADLLRLCLASVARFAPPGTEVIVVDDGSPAGVVTRTAREFAGVRVIRHATGARLLRVRERRNRGGNRTGRGVAQR